MNKKENLFIIKFTHRETNYMVTTEDDDSSEFKLMLMPWTGHETVLKVG